MKARVKATNEIIDVSRLVDKYIMTNHPYSITFDRGELELIDDYEPDYWEKLKHQYAGMAMQGILSNNELYRAICKSRNLETTIMEYATALVNRLKEESKCEK